MGTDGPSRICESLGFTHPKTSCGSTLHYCFNDLDVVALEKILSEWATDVFAATQEDDKNAVAIYGKTLCGSLTQDAQITHLCSESPSRLKGIETECSARCGIR